MCIHNNVWHAYSILNWLGKNHIEHYQLQQDYLSGSFLVQSELLQLNRFQHHDQPLLHVDPLQFMHACITDCYDNDSCMYKFNNMQSPFKECILSKKYPSVTAGSLLVDANVSQMIFLEKLHYCA